MFSKSLKIKSKVFELKVLNDEKEIFTLDENNAVRIFSTENFKLIDGFKITALSKIESPLFQLADIDDKHNIAISAFKKGAILFDGRRKKFRFTFKRHLGGVESIAISSKHNFVATGGEDGKTFLWSMTTGKMAISMPHHSDFVTFIKFSEDGHWLATGSYDKNINVSNINSVKLTATLKGHTAAITNIIFLDNFQIISSDKDGHIILWDFAKRKLLHRFEKMSSEIKSMAVAKKESFLFVTDKSGYISLYDIKNRSLIEKKYFYFKEGVSRLLYLQNSGYLLVALLTGEIKIFNPTEDKKRLVEFINEKKYKEAYLLAEENPFLKLSDDYKRIDEDWQKAYNVALKLYDKEMVDEAIKTLEPFKELPQKQSLVKNLINDFKEFKNFKQACLEKRYPYAYSLANQYISLKDSIYYKNMELEWKKHFNLAKKLVREKKRSEDEIRKIFTLFKGVTQKANLIQALIKDRIVFNRFLDHLGRKEYKKALNLADRHPSLKDFDEYKKIENIDEIILEKTKALLKSGDYAQSAKLAKELLDFPNKKHLVEDLISQAETYLLAMKLFAEKEYNKLYALLETNPFLYETEIVNRLEDSWIKLTKKAENFVIKADIKSLKKLFNQFLKYHEKRDRIISFLKEAYIVQIENVIKSKDRNKIKLYINNYAKLFGKDDYIVALAIEKKFINLIPDIEPKDNNLIDILNLPETLD